MQNQIDKTQAISELEKFVQPVALMEFPGEPQHTAVVPPQWQRFLEEQQSGRRMALLTAWDIVTPELPNVLEFLTSALKRLFVLREQSDAVSLLYAYTVGGDELNFYRGRPPVTRVPDRLAAVWERVPARLRSFYMQLHDGWTFLPANSMGPLPLEDWAFLSDDKFDIDNDIARGMGIDIDKVAAVFHNGAGDYLCLNFGDCRVAEASGLIWWHEDPANPEPVDFWGVLDAWVGIFLEEADRLVAGPG